MCKLVGYKRFTSRKNNKEYCVANVVSSYSDRDASRGCVGEKVEEIFLPEEYLNLLTPKDIGRSIDFGYDLSGGRAYLSSVKLV